MLVLEHRTPLHVMVAVVMAFHLYSCMCVHEKGRMVDDMKVARGIHITWLQYVAAVCGCKRWLRELAARCGCMR